MALSAIEKKISIAEAKRSRIFARIQTMYDLIPNLENEKIREQFMLKADNIEDLYKQFAECLDEINLYSLEVRKDFQPNYEPLNAFEDLYNVIKQNVLQLRSSTRTERHPDCKVKLPRLELPTFDGDIVNWPLFYETFKRSIHENSLLSDSERVQYLVGQLTGKAKNVCAGIIPSAENYKVLWDALINKFQDNRALATAYLNQLLNIKPISKASSTSLEKFIDKFSTIVAALGQIKITNLHEFIFVHIGIRTLDAETAKSFEASLKDALAYPSCDEFIKFVQAQVKILQRTNANIKAETTSGNNKPFIHKPSHPQVYFNTHREKCLFCDQSDHSQLYRCSKFLELLPIDRLHFIKKNNYCTNCLSTKHNFSMCQSSKVCKVCSNRHNSLLHIESAKKQISQIGTQNYEVSKVVPSTSSDPVTLYATSKDITNMAPSTVLLATAQVYLVDQEGKQQLIRILLDSASQSHLITEKCCQKHGLNFINEKSHLTIKGIGSSYQRVKGLVNATIISKFDFEYSFSIKALVVDSITDRLPSSPVDPTSVTNLRNLPLADTQFHIPGEIDVIIGAQLFSQLILPISNSMTNKIQPQILNTVFGYVLMGEVPINLKSNVIQSFCTTTEQSLESLLQKFWALEEVKASSLQTPEDQATEDFYKSTTIRNNSGNYVVALPFAINPNVLGNSYSIAEQRFLNLERKFLHQPNLKEQYNTIIKEYLKKHYISPVSADSENNLAYYIPHHAIVRNDKLTTKLRIVLDASCKTQSGHSLNDCLYKGPNLQSDLFSILLNFRLFACAISADIKQMYLQILVKEEYRKFQRILYRFKPQDPITIYEFNRVCFGIKPSPFLAIRTLRQLATDEQLNFPIASKIINRDMYVDDVVSSLPSEEEGVTAANQLINIFKTGGFDLLKFISNSAHILKSVPESHRINDHAIELDESETLKVLGMTWLPASDTFKFFVNLNYRKCTKRNILSTIARLWDVLGFVAPVTLYAKLLMQSLWLLKINWDEEPPSHIVSAWTKFQNQLPLIQDLVLPRHLGVTQQSEIRVLGFSDASEKAYGAVVYLHVYYPVDNRNIVRIVCAKSKVAPVKTITVARLELCAALLLSKLIRIVVDTYESRFKIDNIYAFTDSSVVLHWVHSSPHRWQTFVANRVTKIQENLSSHHFYHIAGIDNPCDCLSRGLTPSQLINHPLWFNGPSWVLQPISEWPIQTFTFLSDENIPDRKVISLSVVTRENPLLYLLASRISSWSKLLRIVVYIFRFIRKLPANRKITASDLDFAESRVLQVVQFVHFRQDLENLEKKRICSSTLQKLNPFLSDGIIRVGGRLSRADVRYEQIHPIILPRKGHIINLIIDYYHRKYCHPGPNLLMSIIRQRFWILSARRIIRQRIHKCNFCFRTKPIPNTPFMAELPSARVNKVEKAFTFTGCDYAGPISITLTRKRGVRSQKAYICLFVCLTTRAIHIELASDLSTPSFLNALKRFLSRRGPISCIYTDRGTNFIGAKGQLDQLYHFSNSKEYSDGFERELSENRIQWKLIPPHAPHFGGSWEANVKSVKTHLFRVIGSQLLTYEELYTVLNQIEALLNSRPLCAQLSSDPSEPLALTPAHFLNTTPLKSLPAQEISEERTHLIQRHLLLDKLVQSFWKRWKQEYLHTLQIRAKWNKTTEPIKVGTVVIMHQDNVAPLKWPLGIVTDVYPGQDGIIRVALVKTKDSVFKRPVVKLSPLPSQ